MMADEKLAKHFGLIPHQGMARALQDYRQTGRQFDAAALCALPDMLQLIKAAAGDGPVLDRFAEEFDAKPSYLMEVAQFQLRRLLADAGDNAFQMLALPVDAGAQQIREHKRWLLKWLHPDRNSSPWEASLFAAVSQAAEQLNSNQPLMSKPLPEGRLRPNRLRYRRVVERHTLRRRGIKFAFGMVGLLFVALAGSWILLGNEAQGAFFTGRWF